MTPHVLLANFEVLADAPGGVQRLRELVLELAVRGKLVEQDPGDEPASDLLKWIKEVIGKEKAGRKKRVPKSGIGSDPSNNANHEDVALPESWCFAPLGDLIETMDAGWSPACSAHITSSEDEWGVLKTTAVQANAFQPWHHKALPPTAAPRPECVVSSGDLLVTRAGPWFRVGVCCFVNTTRTRLMLSDKIIRCRFAHDLLEGRWLAICVNSGLASSYLRSKQTGMDSAQVNISQGRLSSAPIEIPPLAEQRRILGRVDDLMALLDRLEAKRQEHETARAAARDSALSVLRDAPTPEDVETAWLGVQDRFHDLFTTPEDIVPLRQTILQIAVRGWLVPQDPEDEPISEMVKRIKAKKARLLNEGRIRASKESIPVATEETRFKLPPGWSWLRMDEICDIKGGVTKGRNLHGREIVELPYLRVANVQAGYIDLRILKTIPIPIDESTDYRLEVGDILLTEGGDWDKLGRSAVWAGEVDPCIHQNHIFRARPLDHGILPQWLSGFTNSPDGRAHFQSCSKQTTNLASINMTQLKNCPVPIPPRQEQVRILARLDELMAHLGRLKEANATVQTLSAAFSSAAVHHLDS